MISKDIVIQLVEDFLENSETFLVDVKISPYNEIVVEIDSENTIDIEVCCLLSKHIEANLDREVEDYELEVGSAGITAPFKIHRQYVKNIGNEVEVLANGKKMIGELVSVDDDNFTINISKKDKATKKMVVEPVVLKYSEVKYTKYNFKFK